MSISGISRCLVRERVGKLMANKVCLKCGGTGIDAFGNKCDCGASTQVSVPLSISVPLQYFQVKFDARLLPEDLPTSYGSYMTKLLKDCSNTSDLFQKNVLVCAPPNSGKTVLAYTVLEVLYGGGYEVYPLKDIMEVRESLHNYYKDYTEQLRLLSVAPVVFIKIPLDIPGKLGETISTIVERRVRAGHGTVFLYSGSKEDLLAQDTFGHLRSILGDGSYNSLSIVSWKKEERSSSEV